MLEYRFAQLTALATFVLLIIGGTVNPTGSSLACPEPTLVCNGELFPQMTGGVLYEHGHRLAAMTVGFLQIILTVLLLRRRKQLRALAWASLAMVCLQGGLGAVTVAFKLVVSVSTAHLALALTYFATLIYIAYRTRPEAINATATRGTLSVRPLIAIGAGFVAAQIIVGGLVRHMGAALACLDVPFCEGGLIPEAGLQKLQLAHRGLGVLVGLVTIALAIRIFRRSEGRLAVKQLAVLAMLLVLVQIGLGFATVLTLRNVPVAVAHFGGAAALWCTWIVMWWAAADVPRAELRRKVSSEVQGPSRLSQGAAL